MNHPLESHFSLPLQNYHLAQKGKVQIQYICKSKYLTHGWSNYYQSFAEHRERALQSRFVANTNLNIFNIWRQLFCQQQGLGPKALICSCFQSLALTQKQPSYITLKTQIAPEETLIEEEVKYCMEALGVGFFLLLFYSLLVSRPVRVGNNTDFIRCSSLLR